MDARACNENAHPETLFNCSINAVAVYVNARFGLGIRNVCKRCIFALRSPTIHLRSAADFAVKMFHCIDAYVDNVLFNLTTLQLDAYHPTGFRLRFGRATLRWPLEALRAVGSRSNSSRPNNTWLSF